MHDINIAETLVFGIYAGLCKAPIVDHWIMIMLSFMNRTILDLSFLHICVS